MALATNTSPGEIQLAGDLAGNNDATAPELTDLGIVSGQYVYPSVTVDNKGRITNIVTGDPSTLSNLIPAASATARGTVQAGLGLSVNQNALAGYNEVNFNTAIDGTELTDLVSCAEYSITITVDFGITQVITLSNVILTTINDIINQINNLLSGATGTVVNGKVRFTSDTTGRLSLVEINDDNVFKCATGFTSIALVVVGLASCEINADIATISNVGIIQVGSGLAVDGTGLLSTNIASSTNLGTVQIGSGLTVDGTGVLSATAIPDGSLSVKGIVQIGTGIDVTNGLISASVANNTDKGIVSSANVNNISITAGNINVGSDIALLNVSNNWTTAQVVSPVSVSSAANVIVVDASLSNNFTILMNEDSTLQDLNNIAAGARYTFVITQDSTGSRLLIFDTTFKFKNGSDKTLSTASGSVDILSCVSDGTNLYCSLTKGFV